MFFKSKWSKGKEKTKEKEKEKEKVEKDASRAKRGAANPEKTAPTSVSSPSGALAPSASESVSEESSAGPKASRNARIPPLDPVQAYGAIIAVLSKSKRHRRRTLGEVQEVVAPAVINGQYSLLQARRVSSGLDTPVAAVLWASVSDEVDRRLSTETVVKLGSLDWKSGKIIWIVDAVGESRILDAMVKRLREKAWKGCSVKMRLQNASGKIATRVIQSATA